MKKANIFAHRGRWNNNEKNKMIALSSALQAGYSIETDIKVIKEVYAYLMIHLVKTKSVASTNCWGSTSRNCK